MFTYMYLWRIIKWGIAYVDVFNIFLFAWVQEAPILHCIQDAAVDFQFRPWSTTVTACAYWLQAQCLPVSAQRRCCSKVRDKCMTSLCIKATRIVLKWQRIGRMNFSDICWASAVTPREFPVVIECSRELNMWADRGDSSAFRITTDISNDEDSDADGQVDL